MENRKGDEGARFEMFDGNVTERPGEYALMQIFVARGTDPEWICAALNAHDEREKGRAEQERNAKKPWDHYRDGSRAVAAQALDKLEPILADAVGWPHAEKLRELVLELKREMI